MNTRWEVVGCSLSKWKGKKLSSKDRTMPKELQRRDTVQRGLLFHLCKVCITALRMLADSDQHYASSSPPAATASGFSSSAAAALGSTLTPLAGTGSSSSPSASSSSSSSTSSSSSSSSSSSTSAAALPLISSLDEATVFCFFVGG